MRGRSRNNNNKGPNPLTRTYESNGPDVKIRGTAQHIAEKYSQLARDAQASGDPVAAENYFQHAEHYFRIIAAAQEQLREQYGYQQRPFEEEGEDEGFAQVERPNLERANGEDTDPGSQPQPFETRPEGERPARFDRGDRQERGERNNRGDRFDRGDRQDRRERFQRDRNSRQDFQRDEQPRLDLDRDEQRQERHQERNGRDFRRERRREEAETADAGSLPAFLTNPVRTSIAIESEDKTPAPAADQAASEQQEAPRPRRRRRTRAEIEAANADATPPAIEPAAE